MHTVQVRKGFAHRHLLFVRRVYLRLEPLELVTQRVSVVILNDRSVAFRAARDACVGAQRGVGGHEREGGHTLIDVISGTAR